MEKQGIKWEAKLLKINNQNRIAYFENRADLNERIRKN